MASKVYMICDSYESGYGHGIKNDGIDITHTPMEDKECAEAYQIGYEVGKREWESWICREKIYTTGEENETTITNCSVVNQS